MVRGRTDAGRRQREVVDKEWPKFLTVSGGPSVPACVVGMYTRVRTNDDALASIDPRLIKASQGSPFVYLKTPRKEEDRKKEHKSSWGHSICISPDFDDEIWYIGSIFEKTEDYYTVRL